MKFSALGLLTILIWLGIHWECFTGQQVYSKANGAEQISESEDTQLPTVDDQPSTCPTDKETLTSLLLPALPSYANRVIQRSRRLERDVDLFSYVIVASKPDFEPLTLEQNQYTSLFLEAPEQVFFTTLERQYQSKKVIETEHYHWLFLTQTTSGWRVVMVFSRLGYGSQEDLSLPPKETSNGVIGQAIRLWLRDCRAGAIDI